MIGSACQRVSLSTLFLFAYSCSEAEQANDTTIDSSDLSSPSPNSTCLGYFGQPNSKSGLAEGQCNSSCQCELDSYTWSAAPFSSELFGFQLQNEPETLNEDPYTEGEYSESETNLACATTIDWADRSYRLETQQISDVPSEQITHLGPCGACSSMRDLKVYIENIDLTEPVRRCGVLGISDEKEGLTCLEEIGFSEACGMIWYYNTLNTRKKCLQVCLEHLQSTYVDERGELNPCLACDEVESGPIFKAFSGRTRRNSGIPSAICRPCSSISHISHAYLMAPNSEPR